MSQGVRIFGKKLSAAAAPQAEWKFTRRPGGWILAASKDGRRERFMISTARNQVSASLGGRLWFGEWLRVQRESSAGSSSGAGAESDLTAQFPGKVRKILVEKGARVKEGEPLLLIEAMKMEFSVRAPFSGKVKQVLVKEGQQLQPGDRLVDMEGTTDAATDAAGDRAPRGSDL